jgi:hypothetical protein
MMTMVMVRRVRGATLHRGLRPRTPSPCGSLALARPAGACGATLIGAASALGLAPA